MRGTRSGGSSVSSLIGIIPAYAGNTRALTVISHACRDHPRVCGEHHRTLLGRRLQRGSSPRMRGTPGLECEGVGLAGIIPAYAGNTVTLSAMHDAYRDHPRVCGEHTFGILQRFFVSGSSPRMRGTPACKIYSRRSPGIIPAYAGNTTDTIELRTFDWDHPRVCGEHGLGVWTCRGHWGSSPRMRGTRLSLRAGRGHHGIIPAYAGNTSSAAPKGFFNRDHPRVCGEHARFDAFGTLSAGSSPRMRGTPKRHVTICGGIGIIPAYAGNTSNCSLNPATSWDHPRVCGEHRLDFESASVT